MCCVIRSFRRHPPRRASARPSRCPERPRETFEILRGLARNIDINSFDYEMSFSGLQGNVLQSHIHFGQKSVNGAIVIWLCGTAANPGPAGTQVCPQSGTITGHVSAANVVGGAATQQLLAGEFAEALAAMRAGVAYVNVHTTISPGGEIRGQLRGRGMRKEDEREGGDDHKH
ncbi:MAG: CHRD domain-containing protein [Burkholderiaceae bacterium]